MRLPEDYFETIEAGVEALNAVSDQLREEASRRPDAPELWLAVRDYAGLARRLTELERSDWQDGHAILSLSGQDIGALDELPRLDANVAAMVTTGQVRALEKLRSSLSEYLRERHR
jgi:hypothetical protein